MIRIEDLTREHIDSLLDEFAGAPFTLPQAEPYILNNASSIAFIRNDDGRVMGAIGVLDLLGGVGEVWSAHRKEWHERPKELTRSTKSVLDAIWNDAGYHRLELTTPADAGLDKWAKVLGFEYEATLKKRSADQKDIKMFART